jgi:two-component system cell cycle sensor histidine kinase/response regulator CckA
VISRFPDFRKGFEAIANIAAVAGWGDWKLVSLDRQKAECVFRVWNSWEGRYQLALGVSWGSAMLAGKMAGYCSKLFRTNCWAEQTASVARGDEFDEFFVCPSQRSIEKEIESLLTTDEATRADMAVALKKLETEITERRRAQESLRESEERFRSLVETTSDWIWEVDRNGAYAYASPKVRDLLGYAPEEVIGRSFFDFMPPEEAARTSDFFRHVAAAGRPFAGHVKVNLHRDGRRVWIETSGVPVFDAAGSVLGYRGIDRDITERKHAEEIQRQLEAQVQHSQKLESLGVLAGGIAHDFNNLLVAVLGNADLLLRELSEGSPAREKVEDIARASRRAAELCEQMLAYSGKGRFVIEPLQLSALVSEMAQMLEISISKKVALEYDFDEDLPAVEADATQVRQIVLNLITNASEAIGDQRGTIAVRTRVVDVAPEFGSATPSAEALPAGRYVALEVTDTGCGMDAEVREKIFDPFFTTKFTGRGLGLAAVLGIVRGHGGGVDVSSEPGRGTAFRVLFPASEDRLAARGRDVDREASRWQGSGTVLLVDDEPAVRRLGSRMLESLGFLTVTARDGVEAIDLLRGHRDRITCVILDLTMPQMDGKETFRELRAIRPEVPVVLSSGYAEQDATQDFVGKELAGFIQKPYELDTLRAVLRRAIGGVERKGGD